MATDRGRLGPPGMASAPGLRLVEKAVEVLDVLAEHGELTVAQLSETTGEPRSSMYRLVGSLEQLELVEAGSGRGTYRLGTHVLRLGAATFAGLDARDRAVPVLRRLRDDTGLTAFLLVRRGRVGVCVERFEGLRVASLALQVGGSLPLHAGAASRALLAFEPETAWHEYADGMELEPITPHTPRDRDELFEVLTRDRTDGVTLSDGDVTLGIAAVGGPIYDHRGLVQAALSVSGLREEVIGERAPDTRALIRDATAEISASLGYRGVIGKKT